MSLDTYTIESIQDYFIKRQAELEELIFSTQNTLSKYTEELAKTVRFVNELTKELELAEDAVRPSKENDL